MIFNEIQIHEWKKRVEAWQYSYLSMRAWCRIHQVSYDKLIYWRDKLKLEGGRHISQVALNVYPNAEQIYLYVDTVRIHNGFDHFRQLVDKSIKNKPSNSLFVFLSKRRKILKIFSFDSYSQTIWSKRIDRGTFLYDKSAKMSCKQGDFYILYRNLFPKKFA